MPVTLFFLESLILALVTAVLVHFAVTLGAVGSIFSTAGALVTYQALVVDIRRLDLLTRS